MGVDFEAGRLGLGGPWEVPTLGNRIVDATHHRHNEGDDYIGAVEVAQSSREGRVTQPTLGATL